MTKGISASSFPTPPEGIRSFAELVGAPPPTNTRQRLIEAAMELFYMYGFHAVGLDRILADVGISKQAFYRHFASKDDLAAEAITVRDKRETEGFINAVRQRTGLAATPRQTLLAMFDVIDDLFTGPEFRGCLFLTACFEFPSPTDPMHKAAGGHYVAAEGMIRDLAAGTGAVDPAALAIELVQLMQGAFTYRVVAGDDSAARRARKLAELAITAACAGDGDGADGGADGHVRGDGGG